LRGALDGVPVQQRTLRSALDWSHSLLTPVEQTVFRRLAVFTGGFTMALAQDVAAGASTVPAGVEVDPWTVLESLGALVDKSLVIADERETPRYRLLESARMYALERLTEADEIQSTRARHAAALAQVFAEAREAKWTLTEAQWFERFAPELDNARAAFDTAFRGGDVDTAVSLAADTYILSRDLGRYGEARERLEAVRPWIARAQRRIAALGLFALGDFGDAVYQSRIEALKEAHARFRDLDDRQFQYMTAGPLGELLARCGRLADAEALIGEVEQLEDSSWSPRMRAIGWNARAMVAEAAGDIGTAKRAMRQAIALDRAAGWGSRVVTKLTNLVAISLAAGETREAIALGGELLASQAAGRPIPGLAYMNVTGALILEGRLAEARATARVGLPLMQQKAQGYLFIDHLALLAAKEHRPIDAARLAGWADAMYEANASHRDVEESNARAQALASVDAALGKDTRVRLMRAAASLTEDEAVAMAFAEPSRTA